VALTVTITSPKDGDKVVGLQPGVTLTVTGTVTVVGIIIKGLIPLVSVQFSDGDLQNATVTATTPGSYNWSFTGKTPVGGELLISTFATYPNETTAHDSIAVFPDTTPPDLEITSPAIPVPPIIGTFSGAALPVAGTASAHFPIQSVTWQGNWSAGPASSGSARLSSNGLVHWGVGIQIPLGTYTIAFTCTDDGGNTTTKSLQVQVTLRNDIFGTDLQSYLEDLVNFVTQPAIPVNPNLIYARVQTAPGVNAQISDLDQAFCQPFSEFNDPKTYQLYQRKANEPVHKIRVVIEVLRRQLLKFPPGQQQASALTSAEQVYLLAAYTTLLTQIGTSYDELRLSRAASVSDLQALADRLGITADHVNDLLLDPNPPSTSTAVLSETTLEQLFGLVDTTRDPLSDGPVINDSQSQVTRWTLNGVEWNRNTDANGEGSLTLAANGLLLRATLSAGANVVAGGQANPASPGSKTYLVPLAQANESGLSGEVSVSLKTERETVTLSVIPEFLSWQMLHLQSLWSNSDFPPRLLSLSANLGQPGQKGLSVTITGEFTHFVQGTTTADFGPGITVTAVNVSSATALTALLNIDPAAAVGLRDVIVTTGSEMVTSSNAIIVTAGAPIVTQVAPNTAEPGQRNLTVAITGQSTHFAQGGTSPTTVSFGNGITVVSFSVKSATSVTAVINVDPAASLGLRDVTLTTGAEVATGTSGFNLTPANLPAYPLIDPDLLYAADFKYQNATDPAYGQTYLVRVQLVQSWHDGLKQQRENATGELVNPTTLQKGLDAILARALGMTSADLKNLDTSRTKGADISWQLTNKNLSPAAFNYLLRVIALIGTLKGKENLLASEWEDVYNILVQVLKLAAFPSWKTAEQALGLTLGPDWFQIATPVTANPPQVSPWRASSQARQAWLNTLQGRINQRQDLVQGLQAAIDAAEVATLPILRDALVAALSNLALELYSTGVDVLTLVLTAGAGAAAGNTTSTVRAAAGGPSSDKRWLIVKTPAEAGQNPAPVTQALNSSWMPDTASNGSQWISPQLNETQGTDAPGDYVYQTSFDLTGIDPNSVQISLAVAVDDTLTALQLNTVPQNLPVNASTNAFSSVAINTGFVPGKNVLNFTVHNDSTAPHPSGLRVEFSATTSDPGVADRLSEWFLIDVECSSYQSTTRLSQAVETLQNLFFALRTDKFHGLPSLESWTLTEKTLDFDQEWSWMGTYATWVSAMQVFLYPENLLQPGWRDWSPTVPSTQAFQDMVSQLVDLQPLTAAKALSAANSYLSEIGNLFDVTSTYSKTLFSTGVDAANENLLQDGKPDSNWLLYAVPSTILKPDPQDTVVTVLSSTWVPNGAKSQWVIPNQSLGEFPGSYTYKTTFTVPASVDPATTRFSSKIAADDSIADIKLNGTSLAIQVNGFTALTPIDITKGFVAGSNVLEVDVVNAGIVPNPTGLRVQLCDLPSQYFDPQRIGSQDLDSLRALQQQLFTKYAHQPNLIYLQELFGFVPLYLAQQLQQAGEYEAALDWYRLVYAYDLPVDQRKIYYGLVLEDPKVLTTIYAKVPLWLLYPLDPHQYAATRANAYTHFTLLSIIRVILDSADAEYAKDTFESLARARTLYLTALDLLSYPELQPPSDPRVAPNPAPALLQQHAQVNLLKLRTSRDVAGLVRTAAANGLPYTNGLFPSTAATPAASLKPTAYRYATLIDRAKQLVTLAQQIEASFLASLEKADAENYSALKARQDLSSAAANVQLQNLKVQEAGDGVTLAADQQQAALIKVEHYQDLLSSHLLDLQQAAIIMMGAEVVNQSIAASSSTLAAVASGFSFNWSGIGSDAAAAASATAATVAAGVQILQAQVSLEETKKDWQFNLDLANQDSVIANQQYTIALDQQNVANQEQSIATLQQTHAQAVVDFLTTQKFTNAVLYEWMSGILQRVYSYFLQQAAAVARMAQTQLAFERQIPPPNFIQADYWQTPVNTGTMAAGATPTDTKGLTGSARLLEDITQLDEFAFETDHRKLQLVKIISLAQLDGFRFQKFTETGVLRFETTADLFDRDFPGHIVRLIKRVRVSVIALIPPTQGIRATLANPGISRVVVEDPTLGFQTLTVRREPQLIALSSPANSNGLFDLADTQPGLLLPFENLGADTVWEFSMPQAANPFDYTTIADVLVTLDYTAIDSPDYRQQVTRQLDGSTSAERTYSFRQQFADAWYDLNNPDVAATHIAVQFQTVLQDFQPNIMTPAIAQVLMYFVPAAGASFQIQPTLKLTQISPGGKTTTVGGTATSALDPKLDANSLSAVFSTRTGNASAWIPMIGLAPVGNWSLDVPNTARAPNLFQSGQVQDILFVITYNGQLPAWPTY